ncbi:GNAT family N-acetyltransferase [Pectobacterium brasiliense]|uniref:GNAT family N-acetyltransferase n=1 Tax=Pectobacterium brasiliense TaxID=180957 RepID=A0AAW9HC64_9GAMM|nr:GNAT family N-acetyltransferase [Pectobacterium brasiliense]MDY4379457.1 GNAT family N-acetyltransferase [Pectobacterium brasiliense]
MYQLKLEIANSSHELSLRNFISRMSVQEKENLLGDAEIFFFQAIKNSNLFVAIDGKDVIALSAVDPLGDDLIETRTCFVLPEYRGLGLQRIMHEVRAINIRQRWGYECVAVSAVKRSTLATRENLLALGFKLWNEPDKRVFSPCKRCQAFDLSKNTNCCCDFFYADKNVLAALSDHLIAYPLRNVINSKGIGAWIDCRNFSNYC